MSSRKLNSYDYTPVNLRKEILKMAFSGSTVHIGCAFSIVEILSVLYKDFLRYPSNNPNSISRDIFILSKGHGVMAQYACMLQKGWINREDLENYFKDGTILKGLADSRVNGIETSTGSLGHGLSVGVGMALANKLKNNDRKTIVLVGDGEINEGSIWEGLLFASHHRLNNFLLIIDYNKFQAMGKIDEIISLDRLDRKLESFGFHAHTLNGHDGSELTKAFSEFYNHKKQKPSVIIANTIKGKGISFMENNNIWHYSRLDKELYLKALAELKS